MKKPYCRPQLFYEKFELSQHIASCELQLNHDLGYGCSASGNLGGFLPVEGAFIDSDTACSTHFEEYCYTNSVEIVLTYAS